MKVVIGADHRGFDLKEKLMSFLHDKFSVVDMGAYSLDLKDDYTLYAEKVASIVSKEPTTKGILLCGSGVGVDIAANKIDGVRASIGLSPEQVKAGRQHDDMNILVIAADFTNEKIALEMASVFLHTNFDEKLRHKRRLFDIQKLEENN